MFYPLLLDVYYSTTTQNDLGELIHVWSYDRSVKCRLASNTNYKDQNLYPEQRLRILDQINAQITEDIRVDSFGEMHGLTDILVANLRANCGGVIYKETAGPRAGDSTVYEVVGYMPHVDPFNHLDYVKVVFNRADEQAIV
jgi:hypothetical protein